MTATASPLVSLSRCNLSDVFRAVRRQTMELCKPLTPEDMMVQSCPEASPAKWHIAHTTWFFESFVLKQFLAGYRAFNEDFTWLFNSYYQTFSAFPEKRLRSSFSRPALDEILRYREHVDRAMERLLELGPEEEALRRIELGVNHEEQHQELLLTDILNAFFTNPLKPKYREQGSEGARERTDAAQLGFTQFDGGLREAGHVGEGFCYDNELPRHRVWLETFALADRLVTCGEFAEFMADGGYRRPELWLSAGWDAVKQNGWRAPLYWSDAASSQSEGSQSAWTIFTLRGDLPLAELAADPGEPSELLRGRRLRPLGRDRLPTEFEWEAAAEGRRSRRESSRLGVLRTVLALDESSGSYEYKPSGAVLRGLLGVDIERLPWLSGIQALEWHTGRIQRQVYERPDGIAWRVVRNAHAAYPGHLPQLLFAGNALAVLRNLPGEVTARSPIQPKEELSEGVQQTFHIAIRA